MSGPLIFTKEDWMAMAKTQVPALTDEQLAAMWANVERFHAEHNKKSGDSNAIPS